MAIIYCFSIRVLYSNLKGSASDINLNQYNLFFSSSHPLNLLPFQTIYDNDVDYDDEDRKSFISGYFHHVYHKHRQFEVINMDIHNKKS